MLSESNNQTYSAYNLPSESARVTEQGQLKVVYIVTAASSQ